MFYNVGPEKSVRVRTPGKCDPYHETHLLDYYERYDTLKVKLAFLPTMTTMDEDRDTLKVDFTCTFMCSFKY